MYIPKHYQNNDEQELVSFIKEHPFGILVTQGNNAPWATHLPFIIQGNTTDGYTLVSHLSKANLQWEDFKNQKEVLVIFNGPQHYISASWYGEEEVPTWDYIAIHAYGEIEIMDEEALKKALQELVHTHEKKEKNPVDLSKMSPHTQSQYKGVVGFTVQVKRFEGAYKLSQTRKKDHPSIIKELKEKKTPQATAVAKAIEKENKKL